MNCEICGEEADTSVCQVILSLPISRRHCRRCLELGIANYDDVITQVWTVPLWNMREEYQDIVFRSLLAAGKTLEELNNDVNELDREYEEFNTKLESQFEQNF